MSTEQAKAEAKAFSETFLAIEAEIGRAVVGQREPVRAIVTGLIAGGHVLLEGVPGVGKTRMVRALSEAVELSYARIQFTPDLMPADILGTTVVAVDERGRKEFSLKKGPIFNHVVLADEVNRATPKTQSALLEAMQERTVSLAGESHKLPPPFYVLATQNPIEMEGTYPLPEAQLDRFMMKIEVEYPSAEDLKSIITRADAFVDDPNAKRVADAARVVAMQATVRRIPATDAAADLAVRMVQLSHPGNPGIPDAVKKSVRYGSSPRGGQALLLVARVRALLDGRFAAGPEDVAAAALPCLRHRILRNFEGEADGVSVDGIVKEIALAAGAKERALFASA